MSKSSGINDAVFKKKFKTTGNYTTVDDVKYEISKYFPSLTGTVQEVTAGNGLKISDGSPSITSKGKIDLYANMKDLEDVSDVVPAANNILYWDGINSIWAPTGPQSLKGSFGEVVISDLKDIGPFTGPQYNYPNILTNTPGTSNLHFEKNLFIQSNKIIDGEGITHNITSYPADLSEVTFKTDLGSIPLIYNSHTGHSFVITDELNEQKRIPSSDIPLKNFDNSGPSPFINNISFTLTGTCPPGNNPFIVLNQGPAVQIGVCLFNFNQINLSTNATGILSIINGGTNGSTPADARVNLGLSPNTDIMAFSNPIFSGKMTGEDIGLCSGTCIYTYLNIGLSSGYSGTGFRFNETLGFIQCQHSSLVGWNTIYPGLSSGSCISSLQDVSVTAPGVSDILIYDNTDSKFKNKPISGFITLDKDGTTRLESGVSIPALQIGLCTVTDTEFSCLTGVVSPIQSQLDIRVKYTQAATRGDMFYYNHPTSGTSTVGSFGIGTKHQIITPGVSLPEWKNVYHSFEPNITFDYQNIGVFNTTGSSGFQTSKNKFLLGIKGTSTGISIGESGTCLCLDIRSTSQSTTISESDLLYFEKPSTYITDYRRNIELSDFWKHFPIVTSVNTGTIPGPCNFALIGDPPSSFGIYSSTFGSWFGVNVNPL